MALSELLAMFVAEAREVSSSSAFVTWVASYPW